MNFCNCPNCATDNCPAAGAEARLKDTLAEIIPALEKASGLKAGGTFDPHIYGPYTKDEIAALWLARKILEEDGERCDKCKKPIEGTRFIRKGHTLCATCLDDT